MALALRDDAAATAYPSGTTTTITVDTLLGNLIVVFIGVVSSTKYCTGVSDTIGNTYTLRSVVLNSNGANVLFAYCLSSIGTNASNVITVTLNTGSVRTNINASTWTVDSGDTVSFDDAANKTSGWEGSPWETASDLTTTGTDELVIAGFQANASARTYSNQEIPSGTAANVLTSPGNGSTIFYRVLSSTLTNEEAETDVDSSAYYACEVLTFKSVSSGGGSTTISDTGSGSDTISITVKRTITDSGAGVDTNSLLSQIQTQDTGAGTEVLSVLAQILKQDSGTGLDIISLLAQFTIQDAGAGSDSVNVAQGIVEKLIFDSGTGTETIALIAQALIQDSGSGAELLSLFVQRVIQDSGAAIDAVDIVAGVVQKLVQDEGTANEVINIITQIIKQDSGTGIDVEAINKAIRILDSGAGVDVIEVIKAGLRLYCFLSGEWKSAKLKVFDNGSFKEKTLKLFGNGQWN